MRRSAVITQEKRARPKDEGDLLDVSNSVAGSAIRTGKQKALLRAVVQTRAEWLGKDIGAHVPGVRLHKRDDAVIDPLPHHREASRLEALLSRDALHLHTLGDGRRVHLKWGGGRPPKSELPK